MAVRKKTYHHKNLRQALLDASIPILAADGIAGLTLRNVARAAGVSHTAPYRHFRDKSALLEAIAVHGHRHLEQACSDAERKFPDDPRTQLIEAGMAYLRFVVDHRAIAHLMFSGDLDPAARGEELRQAAQAAFGALTRIIDNGKTAGLYVDAPSESLTLSALACVHGLAMMIIGGLIEEPRWTAKKLRDIGNIVAGTLLNGMLRKDLL